MRPEYTPKQIERFWSKVDRSGGPDSCWLWTASRNTGGYGQQNINGALRTAHRFMWELINGPIPAGLFVLHRCDNPPCCNPRHLFLGAQIDNMADMHTKGRAPIQKGEANGNARLSDDQATEIRRRYAAGKITQTALAREFGVSQPYVSKLILGHRR